MFPLLSLGFPISYFSLSVGAVLGILVTLATISVFAFCVLMICIYSGMIRITPLFTNLQKLTSLWFPNQEEYVRNFATKMFHVQVKGKLQKRPYILLFHPHGAFSVSYFFHRMTSFTNFPIQDGKACVIRHLYWLPFADEILTALKSVPNRYNAMKKVLDEGESLSVIPGGIHEMFDTKKGRIRVKIKNRSGIFRLAIETKTPLVPVITYGENELYELSRHPYLDRIQQWLLRWNCQLPIPSFSSIQKWIQFMSGVQKTSLLTVLGNPIEIQESHTIDSLRIAYIDELKKLYAETKPADYATNLDIC
jgi:hypothetical protein